MTPRPASVPPIKSQAWGRWDRETALVAQLAACVSFISFAFYFQHSDLLLYGDAVAHINIARRVFDSRTPGLLQLGTVWLPLPHLLILSFLISDCGLAIRYWWLHPFDDRLRIRHCIASSAWYELRWTADSQPDAAAQELPPG